jgi:predicted methyltransferase
MKRTVAYLLLLVMGFPPSMWSQSQGTNTTEMQQKKILEGEQAAKVQTEVQKRGAGERSRVRVTLRNKTEVKGYISQIDADSFQVTDKKSGQITTISYEDAMKIRRNGMSTVAKIAIGAGVVGGAMIGLGLLAYRFKD